MGRELERARAKSGWHVLWFYLSIGLAWGVFMLAANALVQYSYEGSLDTQHLQGTAGIYFVGGLIYGLIMWGMQETPGTGRPGNRP